MAGRQQYRSTSAFSEYIVYYCRSGKSHGGRKIVAGGTISGSCWIVDKTTAPYWSGLQGQGKSLGLCRQCMRGTCQAVCELFDSGCCFLFLVVQCLFASANITARTTPAEFSSTSKHQRRNWKNARINGCCWLQWWDLIDCQSSILNWINLNDLRFQQKYLMIGRFGKAFAR